MGSWRVSPRPLSTDPLHRLGRDEDNTVNTTDGTGASAPKVVQKHVPGHTSEILVCESCGAKAFLSERKRFNKRHPALCSARKALSKQLAQGTRGVDAEESDAHIGPLSVEDQELIRQKYIQQRRERWDAIERALGGEPR